VLVPSGAACLVLSLFWSAYSLVFVRAVFPHWSRFGRAFWPLLRWWTGLVLVFWILFFFNALYLLPNF